VLAIRYDLQELDIVTLYCSRKNTATDSNIADVCYSIASVRRRYVNINVYLYLYKATVAAIAIATATAIAIATAAKESPNNLPHQSLYFLA